MSETRVSPYSLNDLKNTTDDALGNYLRGIKFKQVHTKLDVRLALGYTAVIISAATFAADYKLGWEKTKYWTALAVAVYALLNSALTYWLWFVEKGVVFEGERDGKTISISSKTKKHDPTYYLEVTVDSAPSPLQIQTPFTTWFTADGYFVAKPFQQWLATSVQTIGNFDSKNAGRDERDKLASPTLDIHQLESNGGVTGTAADASGKAGQRKSKKKG